MKRAEHLWVDCSCRRWARTLLYVSFRQESQVPPCWEILLHPTFVLRPAPNPPGSGGPGAGAIDQPSLLSAGHYCPLIRPPTIFKREKQLNSFKSKRSLMPCGFVARKCIPEDYAMFLPRRGRPKAILTLQRNNCQWRCWCWLTSAIDPKLATGHHTIRARQ